MIMITMYVFGHLQPSRLKSLAEDEMREWCDLLTRVFSKDLTADIFAEMTGFRSLFFTDAQDPSKCTVLDFLRYIVQNNLRSEFGNVELVCRMFLTNPVSTAANERAFSAMRRIKNYLRNTMSDCRLSDCGILAVERSTAAALDYDDIVKEFAKMRATGRRAPPFV